MTKKNKAAISNLVIKSAEDLQAGDENSSKPAKNTKKKHSSDAEDHSGKFKSKNKHEPIIIDSQPRLKGFVKSALAVDRGLKLNFFPLPSEMEKVMSSLEILNPVTTVTISQIFDTDDTTSSINQYLIKNDKEEELFFAVEQSSWFERMLFGPSRTFTMSITDCNHQLVIKIRRPATCSMCIPPFQHACLCFNKIYVSAPPGSYAGSVTTSWTIFRTTFDVRDANDDIVFRIKGKREKFDIYNTDDEAVGCIQPECTDPAKAMNAEYQHFAIHFPQEASIKMKAVLIGAVFLVDFLFFDREKKGKGSKFDGINREKPENN